MKAKLWQIKVKMNSFVLRTTLNRILVMVGEDGGYDNTGDVRKEGIPRLIRDFYDFYFVYQHSFWGPVAWNSRVRRAGLTNGLHVTSRNYAATKIFFIPRILSNRCSSFRLTCTI